MRPKVLNLSLHSCCRCILLSIRGNFLLGIQFFWSLGNVVVTMWAWLVLGPYGWRVMAFGCAVPMNISLVGAFFMPESPRWLVSQGRTEEAKQSLLYAANMNGTELKDFQLVGREIGRAHV